MADEDKRKEADDLADRFPRMPSVPDVPEPPKLNPPLPRPAKEQPGAVEPGSYNKSALAFTAANSFIMPVLVLTVAGYFLDKKFGGGKGFFIIGGVVLGMAVGITALLNVLKKMSDDK